MAEITWTAEAQQWLEDIFEYIAQDSPHAAARTVQGIYARAQDLVRFPQLGYRYAASSRHVRILLHEQYRIAYLLKPSRVDCFILYRVSESVLEVLAFWHTSRGSQPRL